ncbi:ABC transporter related protein [Deinococcus proteolyticus MRP]|uniref:ABC transporter related protein n=1 Tax=Deinococcus proteolyticus (strain ATCC 35074 / DSM 20540 / JCM 6276 / NBRC 101906 / NCIMB 13154 / VKM Ac-1939 / CCM 2703 / MRP) TaxID=693977 RepID=F0RL35_DEIPM|nr:ABC transporter ATP-binding protein [Deinococcus proteolyticus]ADY26827.1 ABC transporter related protein [Deinococcus proteolyticus MRP]
MTSPPASDTPAIVTRDLRKSYGSAEVVRGLNIRVGRGEVFGFLGPNGAGKSTTVKMLLGLVRPTSGELQVLGGSPHHPAVRARLGFLPEQFRYQTWMTGHEFLTFHGQLAGLRDSDIRARVPQVLERVGLAGRGGERLDGYSKGMLQRAGLASALLARPELVFLDEPTSALDPIGRIEVRRIIEDLRDEGVSVFLNSHLLSEVGQVCDHVAFVRQGQVLRQGRLSEVMGGDLRARVRLDALTPAALDAVRRFGPVLTQTVDPQGTVTLEVGLQREDQLPEVARLLLGSGAQLYELTPQRPELEDIFLELVGQSGDASPSAPQLEGPHA